MKNITQKTLKREWTGLIDVHTSDIFERSCFRDEIPTLARTNMHAMTNFCNLAARLYPLMLNLQLSMKFQLLKKQQLKS